MRTAVGILIVLVVVAGGATAASFVYGPYSGAPTQTSVSISWLSSDPVPARIDYGVRTDYETTGRFAHSVSVALEQEPSNTPQHVTVTSLAPDSEYTYQVVLETANGEVVSAQGSFVTAPPIGESICFIVLADTQWQWEGENRLAAVGDAIAADPMPFDFILHAGDLVESPTSGMWNHWFDSFAPALLRAPFLPVLGNHERNLRSYYDNFVLPPGDGKSDERWWAFHWGDLVVVGLDTNVTRAPDYIAQQNWARTHLSGPEQHKIVMFHHPVYSSDAFHGSGYSYDVIYHPIFVETGVDLVLNGHAHNYERLQVDGVTYLVVGGGGAVPRDLADTHVEGSILAIEGYNFYVRVTTSLEGIAAEVVSVAQATDETFELTDGHLLDSFLLPL